MSRMGVWQLKQLTLAFSKTGGSSRGVRDFVESQLSKFNQSNPQIRVEFKDELKMSEHPYVKAFYELGNSQLLSLRNKNSQEILKDFVELRNQWGTPPKKITKYQYTTRKSIQGRWSPFIEY